MDQSGRLVNDRPLQAKEMHNDGLPTDIPDKTFSTNVAGELVTDRTLHSIVLQSKTLPENLVDSENKVRVVGHRSSACGSCRSSNDVDGNSQEVNNHIRLENNSSDMRSKLITKTLPTGQVVNLMPELNNHENCSFFGVDSEEQDNQSTTQVLADRPFQRSAQALRNDTDCVERVRREMKKVLLKMDETVPNASSIDDFLCECSVILRNRWRARDQFSEIAFQGLLLVLEFCLAYTKSYDPMFDHFLSSLGYNSVAFWRLAVPLIYDSDLSAGTHYRDALLFALALYDVNNSKSRLRELYAAVPGVRQSMLGIHAKRFGEKYRHLQMMRSRASSRRSSIQGSIENLDLSELEFDEPAENDAHAGGGLTDISHHKQRVINVSNAPPVSIKRKLSGSWEIQQGSGGLVACVDPVMSVDKENIWLANIGMNLQGAARRLPEDHAPPSTNSLGLPLLRQANAGEIFHVLGDDPKPNTLTENERDVEREMSLLSVLHDYNKSNYQLNPVIVNQEDYNTYYGGISNGLLWPVLHNLPEYIVKDYDDEQILREHWCAYVRVNYQFGINAVRNSRLQDFIWIHDYHLMLTGQMMRSLDSNLEVGFFLHIPFQPPDNWMTKYRIVAEPIVRALLRFTKVGFQTHRDRQKYVELVKKHISRARIQYESTVDIFTVTHENFTCSLGVFPVSIKNEDFLNIVKNPVTTKLATEIRKEVNSSLLYFFSVERFDYTKGIADKLKAWKRYFEKYPERIGLDLLYQVAVTNRRSVESYRVYQDDCLKIVDDVNATFPCKNFPNWRPIKFNMDGLPRAKLVAHYLAMDVGVVTPIKDGMNLVAKEMLICNPAAALILSSGAGTEVQLGNAGFYAQDKKCYYRVEDVTDAEVFADCFYKAATESLEVRRGHGILLNQYLMSHDIDEWSTAFLDPSWTHEVIRLTEVKLLADFYQLMDKTCQVRRQIAERVLKGIPIRAHFSVSLENAKASLENSCVPGTHTLILETAAAGDDSDEGGQHLTAKFDITNELAELENDLEFLRFIQSDEVNNVEQFVMTLGSYHPSGQTAFVDEVNKAFALLTEGDHFQHFFTDRDGTLKSYSCSYPASIQPAYSAVIQAQFARRCAQFCAIVTTSPLMHIGILNVSTMPEGYYAYGASAGREWYLNPSLQFKDDSVNDADLALLTNVFERLEELLEQPEYRNFTWIGSGLQRHYGHITIARQDVNYSVPKHRSSLLYQAVCKIVNEVDPTAVTLALREGEFDLKIFTKVALSEVSSATAKISGRIFNKGHGIRLIKSKMGLKLNCGKILVCGDSETDLPMLEECLICSPANVYTIWVTTNLQLQEKVRSLCGTYENDHYVFVSCPEVLLGAMANATVREITIRPQGDDDDDDE
ncbi:trehalose 6-phosphate synthase 1 [Loa loa]|uniref:alpha,alpha-trehalose-phosphate synthase (UDP-forming) n=1 Tax=Loa loa TaxID=7209 RepID=A0A1S0U4Y1_LOALO|nr:trehalose 6-phosphate synthase 1 [Loa loa]EFO25169.2 trehalose 6-phosphate synthase 1 [Loa loa]